MILDFQMNSLTTVEESEKGCWKIVSQVNDDLFGAELTLEVKAPALDIRKANLDVRRDFLGLTPPLVDAILKLVGVRVGPGMTKIVRSLLGGPLGSNRVAEMVLEAMEMLINAITVPELRKANEIGGQPYRPDTDGPKIFLNDRVIGAETAKLMAGNPRLKDSCAAFRDL